MLSGVSLGPAACRLTQPRAGCGVRGILNIWTQNWQVGGCVHMQRLQLQVGDAQLRTMMEVENPGVCVLRMAP